MKKKGITFLILILVSIIGVMPMFVSAANGGLSVSYSSPQSIDSYEYAFLLNKTIYLRDEVIDIDSNFSRASEGFYFALWKQNTSNSIYNGTFTAYYNYIYDNTIYSTDVYSVNGKYSIDLSQINSLDTGNYVVSLICREKQLIYDYYIIIGGDTFDVGHSAEPANYRITVNARTDTNQSHIIIDNQLFPSDSPFNVSGDYMLTGNSLININCDVANLSSESKLMNAYCVTFRGLKAVWKNDNSSAKPLTFRVAIKHKSFGTKILGYINNVNNYASDYTFYIPEEYIKDLDTTIETDDDVFLSLLDVSNASFDSYYSLGWSNLDLHAVYILNLNSDKNAESLGALEDAGDSLSNVNKPTIDIDDLDINNFVDSDSMSDVTAVLNIFYSNQIFIAMIMLVISIAVIAYIFFGKR